MVHLLVGMTIPGLSILFCNILLYINRDLSIIMVLLLSTNVVVLFIIMVFLFMNMILLSVNNNYFILQFASR